MTRDTLAQFGRMRIVRATLLGTVFAGGLVGAASAQSLTVTDLSGSYADIYTVSVPSIEIEGGNLDEAAVRALFENTDGAWDVLGTLDATTVTIPSITVTTVVEAPEGSPTPTGLFSYTYKDLVLTDVADGVAGSAKIGSWDLDIGGFVTGAFGETVTDGVDLAGMFALYGLGTAPGAEGEFRQLYGESTMTGGTITGGEGMFTCTIGNAQGGAFSARPLKGDMAEIQALTMEAEAASLAGEPFDPEKVKTIALFYTDLLTAFTTTPVTWDGFDCSGTNTDGSALAVSAGPLTAGGFEPAKYPEFALNDFNLVLEGETEGAISLGNFTWKKMDFTSAIEVIEAAATLDEAFFMANWRKIIPLMDGFSVADLAIDAPNPEVPGQRVNATLGAFDATLGNYTNGIPADVALSLVNLVLPITEDMKELPIAELKARGITTLDISLGTDLAWDAATSTIAVNDVLIDLGSLGKINLAGTFGNATEALFSDNTDEATMAAMTLTLKEITVDIEDRGIGAFLVAQGAREAGQPEASFRTALAGMAQGMTLAFLGNSTEALTAAQQLGIFLQGASNLTMTITANDEAGLGLADLAAAESDPTALAGKITVVATASGDPVTLPLVDEGQTVQDQKEDLKAPASN
ncbi:MAG: hypothetical protein ACO1OG_03005 [Devosia sp.]